MAKVTLSSDAYGSLPEFDADGQLIGYGVAQPSSVLTQIRAMVFKVCAVVRASASDVPSH